MVSIYRYMYLFLISLLIMCMACKESNSDILRPEHFMMELDGRQTKLYTLKNRTGAIAQFSDYGGRWLSMWVPDKDGKPEDVVLGFDNIEGYRSAAEGYHGAITGRVCARINNAMFVLDGQTYHLAHNDGFGKPERNHLHGGVEGFHRKVWNAECNTNVKGAQYVEFSRISPDGEKVTLGIWT